MTSDLKKVMARGMITYRISDIIAACGEYNFDIDDTVADITQSCIFDLITGWTLEDLMSDVEGNIDAMTKAAQEALDDYGVVVYKVKLTDFSEVQSVNLAGFELNVGLNEG